MGSTSACAAEKSFVSGYGLSCKRAMKLFGGQIGSLSDEFGSLSGSSKGVLADLGLSVAGSATNDSSLKIGSILTMANSMHAHANPVDAKALKKPEKALPCPRCNSVDTKFCYFNNYNVNQPRHFCKGCQRYWTAGGTLRNVAVGAGQRKRKHTSPDSDSQDSVIEDCIPHDLAPVKLLGRTVSAFPKDEFALGPSISLKHQTLPCERIPCTFLSNPPSPNTEKGSFSEFMYSKQTVTPFGKVEPPCNLHTFKEQASTFYEYLLPKHIVAPLDNVRVSHNSFERACDSVYADCSKKGVLNWRMDLQHNECSDVGNKIVPTTSSEMQASNESGCASSLTMQGVSVDACVTDGKSDVIDSEVAEEIDELDKGGCYATTNLQTTHISPCTTHMDGCASATSSVHYDSNSGARIAPTWERHLENSVFKPASPIMSPVSTWGPPADKGLLWGFHWGPAASAVDAAKAALIPNTGSAQKHQTETSRPSEMRIWIPKTLRIKDADEAARSSIWSTLGIRDRDASVLSEKVEPVFQCQAKGADGSASQSQHASPVALMHSTAFQEST